MAARVAFGLLLSFGPSDCVSGTVKHEDNPIPLGNDQHRDTEQEVESEEPESVDDDAGASDASTNTMGASNTSSSRMAAVLLNEFNSGKEPAWFLFNKRAKSSITFGVPDPLARDNIAPDL